MTSVSAIGNAIGGFFASIGSTISSTQLGQLVTSVVGVVNPNATAEHNLLAKMAAFAVTEPALVPDLAKQFSEVADQTLAGAIAPLLTLPLPANALSIVMTAETMMQQGM